MLINFGCLRNARKHLEELSPGDGAANAHGNIMKGKDPLVNISDDDFPTNNHSLGEKRFEKQLSKPTKYP